MRNILLDSLKPPPQIYYGAELTFDEKEHRYEWGGKYVPGVTTILKILDKPALMPWAAKMCAEHIRENYRTGMTPDEFSALCDAGKAAHRNIKEEAADIGKMVHAYAEAILQGKPPTTPNNELALKGIAAFENWLKEHEIEPIALERRVFSKEHWYAGMTDFYGFIDGNRAILDWKTSSGIWDEYWYQTSGYEHAIKEETGISDPMDRWIIRLDKKTGEFEAERRPFNQLHADAWLQIRALSKTLTIIDMNAKAEKAKAKEAAKAKKAAEKEQAKAEKAAAKEAAKASKKKAA